MTRADEVERAVSDLLAVIDRPDSNQTAEARVLIGALRASISLPSPTGGGAKCWDVDLCCGDDLCRFDNGESLPKGVYCAKSTPPSKEA